MKAVSTLVAEGGRIVVDRYQRNMRNAFHPKTWLRPTTTRIDSLKLFSVVERATPTLLSVRQDCGRVLVIRRYLRCMIQEANYKRIIPLSDRKLLEWATPDMYDWLSIRYGQPRTPGILRKCLDEPGPEEVEEFRANHLTGRNRKPAQRALS